MRRSSLLAFAALGLGCGDSAGPAAVVPKTVVPTGGGGQALPTGSTLPVPLGVLVTGSNDRPLAGATVTWTVPTGAASLSPTSSITDASGSAATTLTLGGQIGPVVVHATVPGISPVPFTATALDPCDYLWPYTLGTTVARTLANTDCLVAGSYYTDFYGLTIPAQQGLTITMSSPTFGPWIDLYRINGDFVAFDGDQQVGSSARIGAIVAPGTYVLGPNSFDEFDLGSYSMSAVARPQTVASCELVWVTRGVTVTDSITGGDCANTDASGTYYSDAVAIIALTNSVLTIAERSTAIDAFLALYRFDPNGDTLALLASNDDSAGIGPNAYLVDTVPQTDVYFLFIGTAGAGETGAYSLAVSASATAAASQPLFGGSFRGVKQGPFRLPKVWPLPMRGSPR